MLKSVFTQQQQWIYFPWPILQQSVEFQHSISTFGKKSTFPLPL